MLDAPESLCDWYKEVGDDYIANELLNNAFFKLFNLDRSNIDRTPKLDKVMLIVQENYGWMLFELVMDMVGEVYEIIKVRLSVPYREVRIKLGLIVHD